MSNVDPWRVSRNAINVGVRSEARVKRAARMSDGGEVLRGTGTRKVSEGVVLELNLCKACEAGRRRVRQEEGCIGLEEKDSKRKV